MVKKILETEPLTLAEVKSTLTKRGKKAELSYIQRVTLEHTMKFSSLPARTARALVKKLIKKFEMDESLAIQIVDILPTTTEEITAFLSRAPRSYTEEEINEIFSMIDEPRRREAGK